MTPDDDVVEVVGSVGALDAVVALLRDYLHRTGALRAVALVDRAPGEGPAVVDCGRLAPVEVDLGDRRVYLPHAVELDVPTPELPALRQLPPFEVDAQAGELSGPIGGLAHVVDGVRALAAALGGRNVALAQFETSDPDAPLTVTARAEPGEPLVVALGEEEFELDEAWPAPRNGG